MSNKLSVVALVLSLVAVVIAWQGAGQQQDGVADAHKQTAFERVTKTRTIRCAYAAWPPYFVIDPNTKKMSGVNYEIMEEVGRVSGLKIEWVEEVGYGVFPENLRMGKEDAFCSGAREGVTRAMGTELTKPMYMTAMYPYVREGDHRFDGNVALINSPDVTIASIDGSMIDGIAKATFPLAKRTTLPEMADAVQIMAEVAGQKADVAINDALFVDGYNQKNLGNQLRAVANIAPLKISGAMFAVGKGEWELRDLINAAVTELQGDGTMDRIIEKSGIYGKGVLPVVKPYLLPVNTQ